MPGVTIPVSEKVFIVYVQLWQYNKDVLNETQCNIVVLLQKSASKVKCVNKWKTFL